MAKVMRKRRWWQRLMGTVGAALARTGDALNRQAGEADSAVAPEPVDEPPAHWLELLSQSEVPLVWLERRTDDAAPRQPPEGWQARVLWYQGSPPERETEPAGPESAEMPADPATGQPHYQPAVLSPSAPQPLLRMPGPSIQRYRPGEAKWPQPLVQPPAHSERRHETHNPAEASQSPVSAPSYPAQADQPQRSSRSPLLRWFRPAPPSKPARLSAPDAPVLGTPAAETHFSPPRPAERRPARYTAPPARLRPTFGRRPDSAALSSAGPDYGERLQPATAAGPHYGRRPHPTPAESRWPELPPETGAAAQRYQAALPPAAVRALWPEAAPATAARPDSFAALGAAGDSAAANSAESLPADQWPALPPDWLAAEVASSQPRFEEAHRLRLEREQRGE